MTIIIRVTYLPIIMLTSAFSFSQDVVSEQSYLLKSTPDVTRVSYSPVGFICDDLCLSILSCFCCCVAPAEEPDDREQYLSFGWSEEHN
ncbi:MAG: hypothetical protein KF820_07935 [Candidatus Paracaedibacteraceae bacterium]|nr:hypothetical protein [Candidatus Paracaedibacteraceae bacterium]